MTSGACTSCPAGKIISGTGCVDGVVIVIEIDGTTEEDLKKEIEGMLGIVVTVVEISESVFEITVTDDATATDLVSATRHCRAQP
jgi:riboflavin synthase